jgi:Cu+-exporting ATPase
MTIDSASATEKATYQGQTFYFCSAGCRQQFEANPAKFVGETAGARHESDQRPEAR